MNQIQRLIDSIRDAPHDAVMVAGMFAIPALVALWIVNRLCATRSAAYYTRLLSPAWDSLLCRGYLAPS